MKQFSFGLLACLAIALPVQGADVIEPDAQSPSMALEASPPSHDPSLCLDGMVTEPWTDDLEPLPSAMDAHCAIPEQPIAT